MLQECGGHVTGNMFWTSMLSLDRNKGNKRETEKLATVGVLSKLKLHIFPNILVGGGAE